MNGVGITTLTVETLGAVSKFARFAGDLVRDIIVGFGSIISAVSYITSAGAPISRVMAVASGVIELLAPVISNVLVSLIAIGETISGNVAYFGLYAFGPLGEFIGKLLGYAFIVGVKVTEWFLTVVLPLLIKLAAAAAAAAASTGGAAAGAAV